MAKLLPILIVVLGLALGGGAGWFLQPKVVPPEDTESSTETPTEEQPEEEEDPLREYVKLNNQFIVPVVKDGKVDSLVVLSLNIEVTAGTREQVFNREPKIRDALLSTLFDHANMGGFDGAFTQSSVMNSLRRALVRSAQSVIGDAAKDVLVIDIVRQDIG